MSNAIGSSRESNPSRRICNLRAVPLGHAADYMIAVLHEQDIEYNCAIVLVANDCFFLKVIYRPQVVVRDVVKHPPKEKENKTTKRRSLRLQAKAYLSKPLTCIDGKLNNSIETEESISFSRYDIFKCKS